MRTNLPPPPPPCERFITARAHLARPHLRNWRNSVSVSIQFSFYYVPASRLPPSRRTHIFTSRDTSRCLWPFWHVSRHPGVRDALQFLRRSDVRPGSPTGKWLASETEPFMNELQICLAKFHRDKNPDSDRFALKHFLIATIVVALISHASESSTNHKIDESPEEDNTKEEKGERE